MISPIRAWSFLRRQVTGRSTRPNSARCAVVTVSRRPRHARRSRNWGWWVSTDLEEPPSSKLVYCLCRAKKWLATNSPICGRNIFAPTTRTHLATLYSERLLSKLPVTLRARIFSSLRSLSCVTVRHFRLLYFVRSCTRVELMNVNFASLPYSWFNPCDRISRAQTSFPLLKRFQMREQLAGIYLPLYQVLSLRLRSIGAKTMSD